MMDDEPSLNKNPLVDFLSSRSPVQSASQKFDKSIILLSTILETQGEGAFWVPKKMLGNCKVGCLGSTSEPAEEGYDIGDVRSSLVAKSNVPISLW